MFFCESIVGLVIGEHVDKMFIEGVSACEIRLERLVTAKLNSHSVAVTWSFCLMRSHAFVMQNPNAVPNTPKHSAAKAKHTKEDPVERRRSIAICFRPLVVATLIPVQSAKLLR